MQNLLNSINLYFSKIINVVLLSSKDDLNLSSFNIVFCDLNDFDLCLELDIRERFDEIYLLL